MWASLVPTLTRDICLISGCHAPAIIVELLMHSGQCIELLLQCLSSRHCSKMIHTAIHQLKSMEQDLLPQASAKLYTQHLVVCDMGVLILHTYRGISGMKKDPLLPAAPKGGALEGRPGLSAEVLRLPKRPWREIGPRASCELSLPHRVSWELLLEPGASEVPLPGRRELPRAGGVLLSLHKWTSLASKFTKSHSSG